jgi:tRNA (guanine37-N1)-methyltransferase
MRFDIITIFTEFFAGPLDFGIVRRAREARLIEARVHDLRDFTHDRHRTVDDRPFGGGEGMVMKPEPLFEAVQSLVGNLGIPSTAAVVLLSASGRLFRQETARRLAKFERLILLCGRYEGVDERVAEHLATDEISIGDFVLSGGELPAAMVLDAVTRLIPGALGNEASAVRESFAESDAASAPSSAISDPWAVPSGTRGVHENQESQITDHESRYTNRGILDYPHYTRPQEFRGWAVPEVLIGGNHQQIHRWRRGKAIEKTLRNRPDLLDKAALSAEDRGLLAELNASRKK